jgi:hypothetical protein|tara:strand:+ start:3128 stop:4699 length:1572 start_codon:yes stop_codon:yes gene_type:complete
MIKNIVVVGGGSSGWLTVSNLLFRLPESQNIKITLIESKDIPIIGVGESVTGKMWNCINHFDHLGDEKEFLKKTGSTFKYGIQHIDWYKKGHSFLSPIGSSFVNDTTYPTKDYDYIRILHIAEKMKYEIPLQNRLMLENKVYNIKGEPGNPYKDIIGETGYKQVHDYDVAYHIDANETSKYLREKCINTGRVKRFEDTINDVYLNERGGVESVKLEGGIIIEADLFIDCSGWSRVLINKVGAKFVSYSNNLLVNKAIVFPKPLEENEIMKNHTYITARDYGWTFEIQLQNRTGRGYVFNGDMIDVEKAVDEMSIAYKETIEPKKVLDFNCGRLDRFWINNVLAVGLSSNFVEPMEATAMHTTVSQLDRFLEYYFTKHLDLYNKDLQNDYNEYMNSYMDDMRDFITFHYITPRNDTEFWIESSSEKRWSSELKRKMSIWKTRMPREADYHHNGRHHDLGNALWLQVGLGMHLFDSEIAKKELHYYGLYDRAKKDLQGINKFASYCIERAMTTNEYFKEIGVYND